MEKGLILEKLQQIFRDVFGDDELRISEATCQEDIEDWDSFMHITILEAVMDEFGITFTLDEMVELINVESLVLAINEKVKG